MCYTVDPSGIEKFDTSGIPSKRMRSIMIYGGMIAFITLPFYLLIDMALVRYDVSIFNNSSATIALIMVPWTIVSVGGFALSQFILLYDNVLENYVERGIVTALDPTRSRVCLKGYTQSNVFTESWRVVPRDVRESAHIGQLIDLSYSKT